MLAGAIGQIPQANVGNRNGDDDEYLALGRFQRNNPPVFEGEHEPDKAQAWLKAIEKIFRVMNCTDAQKVQFGTHMLEKEAEDWWNNTLQRFEEDGIEELIKYCPHYNTANAERSKCLKFVNGLRHDIKKDIGYQQITHFTKLVNKSRIYDEDSRESASLYKSLKGKNQDRGKPGGSNVTCFNCGEKGHVSTKCDKPKKEQAKGKVFALSGAEATTDERLIQVLGRNCLTRIHVKQFLDQQLFIKDLGRLGFFPSLEIARSDEGIIMN
ncbi:uncharacterized protein LOC131620127 [Vicia villosa]|uniref:uncharacterized protein LOC131620127 n=1 Tax=Vicia villosa TaxID=3911 RepID=UPI00273B46FC|nr:uncharacterized protein LOC131620127 [Vicia villosa]